MIVSLPDRIPVHLIDFGTLVDAATGAPVAGGGRARLRVTADFPQDCLANALPGRIASHIGGLALALSSHGGRPQATLILPSMDGSSLTHVVVQRIILDPAHEHPSRPGESVRSRGVAFDVVGWARLAPPIVDDLAGLVPVEPVTVNIPTIQRLGIGRPVLRPAVRPTRLVKDLSASACQIIAALAGGHLLRLNRNDCATEQMVRTAFADALTILPQSLRPCVTVAIGLARPDASFQIAWAPELNAARLAGSPVLATLAAMDPEMSLDEAAHQLFNAPARPCETTEAGSLRAWIAAHCRAHGSETVTKDGATAGLADRLGALSRQGAFDVSLAFDLLDDLLCGHVHHGLSDDPALACAASLICDAGAVPFELAGAALALDFAAFAETQPGGRALGEAIALRTTVELHAFLTSVAILSPDGLAAILASYPLTALVADMIHRRDERILWRMRTVIAMAELLGEGGKRLAEEARRQLAPLDGRLQNEWAYRPADANDLQQVLAILIAGHRPEGLDPARDITVIATRLLDLGRRDIIVDALQAAAMGIAADAFLLSDDEISAERHRLELLGCLSSVLLGEMARAAETLQGLPAPLFQTFDPAI